MRQKIKLLMMFIASLTVLVLLFILVNPENKPLILIFLPVLLVWITLYSLTKLAVLTFISKPTKLHTVISFMLTSLVVLIFLLSGIGQLTLTDIVLVVLLGSVSGFYFYRTWV